MVTFFALTKNTPALVSNETALNAAGGYALITLFMPIAMLLITTLIFILLIIVVSVLSQMSEITSQLKDINKSIMRGSLPPEQFITYETETKQNELALKRANASATVIALGIVIGLVAVVCGYLISHDLLRPLLIGSGIAIVFSSILLPIFEKVTSRKNRTHRDASSERTLKKRNVQR